jgi:hypothetical protein
MLINRRPFGRGPNGSSPRGVLARRRWPIFREKRTPRPDDVIAKGGLYCPARGPIDVNQDKKQALSRERACFVVRLEGLEPPAFWSATKRSNPLSYRRKLNYEG